MSDFLRACRAQPVERVPVWFMRQAGRSLPEYRAVRDRHGILEICRTPELAVEVTLQPVRRLGVDAAILFSDIVVALSGMGVDVDIVPGTGPVIAAPVRSAADVDKLDPRGIQERVAYVAESVRMLRNELDVPLIGFAGAPFTLASYLIEGGPSRDHAATRGFMYSEPEIWSKLMDRLADGVIALMRMQIEAGADAVQLFDSWVGALPRTAYRDHARPVVERIFSSLQDLDAPRIYFGVGTAHLLEEMSATGADVIGVDWRVPLDEARARVTGLPVQGNLDPVACLAPRAVMRDHAADVLRRGAGGSHIFNLGHGVLPDTDPGALEDLVAFVHGWRADG